MGAKSKFKQGDVSSKSKKRGRPKSSETRSNRSSSVSSASSNSSEDSEQFKPTANQKKFTETTDKRVTRSQSCLQQNSESVANINSTSTCFSVTTNSTPSTSNNTAPFVQSSNKTSATLASSSDAAVSAEQVGKRNEQKPGSSSFGTSIASKQKGHPNWLREKDAITGKFLSKAEIRRRRREEMVKAKTKREAPKLKGKSGSSNASGLKKVAGKLNGRGTRAVKCKKKNINVTRKKNESKAKDKKKVNQTLSKTLNEGTKRNDSASDWGDSDDEPHPKSTTRARSQKKETGGKKKLAASNPHSLHDVSDYDTDNERSQNPESGRRNEKKTIKDKPLSESEDDAMDSGNSDSEDDAQMCTGQRKSGKKNIRRAASKLDRSKRTKGARKSRVSSESEVSVVEGDTSEDDEDILIGRRSSVKRTSESDPAYSPSGDSSNDASDKDKVDRNLSDVDTLEVAEKQPKKTLRRVQAISESENEEEEKEVRGGDASEIPDVENPQRSQRIENVVEPIPVLVQTDVTSARSKRNLRNIERVYYADMDDSDIEYISSSETLTVKDDAARTSTQRKRKARASPTGKPNTKKPILGKVKEEPLNDEESIQKRDGVSSNYPVDRAANPGPSCSNSDNPSSSNSMSDRNDVSAELRQRKRRINASPNGNHDSKKGMNKVPKPVDIETRLETPLTKDVASTSTAKEASIVSDHQVHRPTNIKTETEAPIPEDVASTSTAEGTSIVSDHQIHRPTNIKSEIEEPIPNHHESRTNMKVEREDFMVSQSVHRQVNIKTEVEDVEVGIKANPASQMQNQSRPVMPQAKLQVHTFHSNSTTPQTSEFSNSVSPNLDVNAVRDVSTNTSHHFMTPPHFPTFSQSYGTSSHVSVEPRETYWRPDQNFSTVPQTSSAYAVPVIDLEAEPEFPSLYSGMNDGVAFSFSPFQMGSYLQESGQYSSLPFAPLSQPSTSEAYNAYQGMWPQYPDNNTWQNRTSVHPMFLSGTQPNSSNQPFEFSKNIYQNVPAAGGVKKEKSEERRKVKKEGELSQAEASLVIEKYLAENPGHQKRKMLFLQRETGWSKYKVNKWFDENRSKILEIKLAAPTTQRALDALFQQRQLVCKETAKLHEQQIGITAEDIYRWMFDKRVEVFEQCRRSGIEELPCQMKVLEKAYTQKKYLQFHNLQHLVQLTKASPTQISGYFKSRRQYDRARGMNVVEMRNMEEERLELMAGHDLVFQDAHWEFSVCRNYLERYSYRNNNPQYGSRELVESRIKARGPMFEHVPLPLNHSTDYKKWTHAEFIQFAKQFLPYKPVNCLIALEVSGSQARRFIRSDKTLFAALNDADGDGNSFTEEAFNSIGTKLQSITEAENQWMIAFNARPKQ
ncbi:hypothetical protein CAEBREN_09580 [Caenorhabditis brenneri]|uniref:Homeobox domain-containing protein n=1 Tax=Caenorhabditis brenneri TaxID=135651 RepID=G0MSX6_CAEBE|nr:hypothetical protein CAEBREN_09580 [Caenorhabditis brenneri]